MDILAAPLSEGHKTIALLTPSQFDRAIALGPTLPLEHGEAETDARAAVTASEESEIAQAVDALFEAIDHTLKFVRAETLALQQLLTIDLAEFNHRKSICTMQLSRAIRILKDRRDLSAVQREELLIRLDELGLALADNCRTLKIHVDAMKRVSVLISNMLQNYESDGTYGPPLNAIDR